jgi:hypothetical protein
MKLLLTIAIAIIGNTAFSQHPQLELRKSLGERFDKKQMDSLLATFKNKYSEKFKQWNKPKAGIHYLADGMPCIVPEEATIGLIRNAWKGSIAVPYRFRDSQMPNPALPQPIRANRVTKKP